MNRIYKYTPESSATFGIKTFCSLLLFDLVMTDQTREKQQKCSHNARERVRRNKLNTKYKELASALPTFRNYYRRPPKHQIIEKALEWVQQKIKSEEYYKEALKHLRIQQKQLQAELKTKRYYNATRISSTPQYTSTGQPPLDVQTSLTDSSVSSQQSSLADPSDDQLASYQLDHSVPSDQSGSDPIPCDTCTNGADQSLKQYSTYFIYYPPPPPPNYNDILL